MQVWIESGDPTEGVDLVLGHNLQIDGDALYIEGKQVGRRVDVSNSEGQSKARAMAGSVEWILLDLGEWKMIPIENIIAACDGGPTKVAARISSPEQVLGAAFALQIGVDALLHLRLLMHARSSIGQGNLMLLSVPACFCRLVFPISNRELCPLGLLRILAVRLQSLSQQPLSASFSCREGFFF